VSELRAWFDARSLREKRLLLAMAALFAIVLVWFGLLRPLGDALSDARRRQADATVRLGETRAAVEAVAAARALAGAPLTGPIEAAVRSRAEAAGFTLTTLNPLGPDRVQVAVPSARPGALVGWAAALERDGLLVESLATTDNGDRTVAGQLTLRRRR
jgi:general secretion pathway protein M